jgi:hypothetical protein
MIASSQMKANKIPPAFIRYLKPRLQPFSRPIFWGSLTILFLLGVSIYQYGRYANWLEASSEKTKNSESFLDKNLLNQVDHSQFSPEELAIGADIDNLDLLLHEINHNQNISLDLFSNSQEDSATQNSEDKSLTRFQAKQQTKFDRSSPASNSVSSSQNDSTSPSFNLIANPVGRLYLSNRQQLFNINQSLSTENNPVHSVNLPTNNTGVNLVPVVTSPLTTSNLLQREATEPKSQIHNTSTTPLGNRSQIINNLGQISLPTSQQYNNLQPINNYNRSELNSNSSQLQRNNSTNYQIQPLNFYQLHPSNYQVQPQGLDQFDRGTLSSPSNNSVSKELLNKTNPIDFNNSIFKSNNLLQ